MAEYKDNILNESYNDQIQTTPRVISNWIYNFAIWKFSKTERIYNPALKKDYFLWKEDDTVSEVMDKGILIAKAFAYKPQDSQQRPAIIVKTNNAELGPKLGLGDKTHLQENLIGSVPANGYPIVSDVYQAVSLGGSTTIFCVHNTPAAAEILGEELWFSLIDFMKVAQRDLDLDEFRPVSLSGLQKIQEFNENWVTSINVIYKLVQARIITEKAPLLKGIKFSTEL